MIANRASTHFVVSFALKYVHIRILSVWLNRWTTAAFWLLSDAKWWMPYWVIKFVMSRLKNSFLLFVWSRSGLLGSANVSTDLNALQTDFPYLFYTGRSRRIKRKHNYGQNIPVAVIFSLKFYHISQIRSPLFVDFIDLDTVTGKVPSCGFLDSVCPLSW